MWQRRGVFGAALAIVLSGPAAAQQSPIVGTWMTTLNPNTPAIIYVTLAILPNGQLQERFMNRQAVSYDLFGTYQFDAAHGIFQYIWSDYQPKQLCSPIGCQAAPVPPGPFNVQTTARVSFPNATQMIGVAGDGTQIIWGRTQ